jgi:putative endonuclease
MEKFLEKLWESAKIALKKSSARTIGQWAENFAERYLELQGLTLIERNFSCKGGEIDLIMEHGNILVFIEVRYRKESNPLETINRAKERRIIHCAEKYLLHYPSGLYPPCRFDVVIIQAQPIEKIEWIPDAFRP